MLYHLRKDINRIADKNRAKTLARFFKTGKGEYGEGDTFLGIKVPDSRKIAIKYKNLPFSDIVKLLKSEIHEERLISLLILVHNFNLSDENEQKKIFDFYLRNTKYVNNWDLVDLSSDKIVGQYLLKRPKEILYVLARSENFWERRIAVIATYSFTKNGEFSETLRIAEILLSDRNDLIQKAVGWMLREVGKRNFKTEEDFLKRNYKNMGRTALRYAIEKFPANLRVSYIRGNI